ALADCPIWANRTRRDGGNDVPERLNHFPSRSREPPCTELGIVHEVATGIERGTIQGADCFPNRNRGLENLCRPPRLTSSAHLLGDLVLNLTRRTATVGGLSLLGTTSLSTLARADWGELNLGE